MNCRKVSHLLSAYMDAELPGFEHRQVHEHIGQCEDCAHEYHSLLRMKRLLAGMRMREPQADLPGRILNHIHAQHASAGSDGRSVWWPMLYSWMEMQIPRRASLPIVASLALAGVVYASCVIDRSEEIDFRRTASDRMYRSINPAIVAELPPMPMSTPDNFNRPGEYPTHFSEPSYSAQPVGNTTYSPTIFVTPVPDPRRLPVQRQSQRQTDPTMPPFGR